MALRTPPSWLQNGSHPAENDRLSMQALYATTGIIGTGSLAVTQSGTPGMSVVIASGWAAIVGTTQSNMGVYMAYNDAAATAAITTANATNPRIDLVCLTVNDAYYTGSTNNVVINVVAGTPASSPSVPATPANSIALAQIAVGANVTSIVNANITDVRVNTTTNLPIVTLTGAQTLTNKTLTTPIISLISNTGLLSLPNSTDTLVGRATTDTLTNKTLTSPVENNPYITSPKELTTVSASSATGTVNFDVLTQGVLYYTSAASANWTLNFRGNSSTALNSIMNNSDSWTVVFLNTNGGTAYYPSAFTIDGTSITPKWTGGTAPSSGNASAIDGYTFTIIKTASATYTVLAAGATKFA